MLQHKKITAPQLAEKFEVSRRTINRDIEDLCKAGIPLVTLQGAGGGIYIADGYKLDKTLFTSEELQAIISGLKSLDSVSGDNRYKQLADKFLVQDYACKDNMYDAGGHIVIDLASHYKGSLAPKIALLKAAIGVSKLVEFDYYSGSGESKREVEPYLIVFQWSNWYLWGYCREREAFRMFKLNRLLNLKVLAAFFAKRNIQSLSKQIDEAFAITVHLVACFDHSVKFRLIEEYGIDSFREVENGELYFEFDFSNKDNLLEWVLGFGDKVKIIEPASIKEEYLRIIAKIREKY